MLIELILHLDDKLLFIVSQYGNFVYFLLFLIVFMETGFVITPFLPGDSLLFAAGALAATDSLSILPTYALLLLAAILGDTLNYWIGHFIGPKVFARESRLIKKAYLLRAQHFYERHGPAAITLARFVPIVRTFAPFVAGIAKMSYKHFIAYNIIGGLLWVSLFTFAGYFFGNLPLVRNNFHLIVLAIILVSVVPILWEWFKSHKREA